LTFIKTSASIPAGIFEFRLWFGGVYRTHRGKPGTAVEFHFGSGWGIRGLSPAILNRPGA
jgi:hypothetical protein